MPVLTADIATTAILRSDQLGKFFLFSDSFFQESAVFTVTVACLLRIMKYGPLFLMIM
jgi:hypothetical protein